MASEFVLAEISGFFKEAYGKPIEPGSYGIWLRTFDEVSDGTMTKAAHRLIEKRDISRMVTPGEMAKAVEAVGGTVRRYKAEESFRDDPIVKALDTRYHAAESMKGITLHEWLKQMELGSFRSATEKYADHNEGVVPVLKMAGATATHRIGGENALREDKQLANEGGTDLPFFKGA